jgi:hypothetical protein
MERQDLDERLLEYGARIIKLVGSLPRMLVGKRIGDQLRDGFRSETTAALS